MSENTETLKTKIVDNLLSFKNLILIFFLIISVFAINYQYNTNSIVINGISPKSPAENAGLLFDSQQSLTTFEQITHIDNQKITSEEQYYKILEQIQEKIQTENLTKTKIRTDRNQYGYTINLQNLSNTTSLANQIGISIRQQAKSNIRLGIELEGGSRLILKPTKELTESEFDLLINNLQSRLDVYGASGTKVNKLSDSFTKEKFVIVESISANKNDIFELIKRQGNFEATLGNKSAFTGKNVLRVLNDPQHEVFKGCPQSPNGEYTCSFTFSIEIDSEGADKVFQHAKTLSVSNGYLSEQISFYLDDKLITSLNVASSFKYSKVTNSQITVSGNSFTDKEKALESAKKEMKFLQAILSTQSLPSELDVVQSYSISSSLGESLLSNAILVGLAALLIVSGTIALRYRQIAIFFGILIALVGEVIIVFGIAAFMKLSIDLAAIGGLIAAIGTGVDDQVIITDEYFRNRKQKASSRKKVKAALAIIMIAYLTTLAAMTPFLMSASLSLIKGFAFMIIVGVTVGVFITRPAYATYLRIMMTTRKQRKEEDEEDE